MKKQVTPSRQAHRTTNFIYAEVVPHAARELDLDLSDPLVKVIIVAAVQRGHIAPNATVIVALNSPADEIEPVAGAATPYPKQATSHG